MKIKQLSVFLENRKGRLAGITDVLAQANVNILALSLADTSDFGILRLIVDDVDKANATLKANNVVSMVNEVTAVEVENQPGGLAKILRVVDAVGGNVEYMYAFAEPQSGKAALIFRFDDPEKAVAALKEAGINVFGELDLS